MESLCRWCQKSFWLKKNCWLRLFLILAVIAVGYPFLVLRLEKNAWLNWFLDGCPFLFQALGLAGLFQKILPFLEINSTLVEISYYVIWAILTLGMMLASKGVKFGKRVACMLLIIDIVINLLSKNYYAIIIDVVILVDICLALLGKTDTKTKDREKTGDGSLS